MTEAEQKYADINNSEFLTGTHTDLYGDIMMCVMLDLLNENGQSYFTHWIDAARSVGQQHDISWLEENVPSIALIMKMENG